jgi:hypothetical protein
MYSSKNNCPRETVPGKMIVNLLLIISKSRKLPVESK